MNSEPARQHETPRLFNLAAIRTGRGVWIAVLGWIAGEYLSAATPGGNFDRIRSVDPVGLPSVAITAATGPKAEGVQSALHAAESVRVPGQAAFAGADERPWQDVFFDPGSGRWSERWFLDGEVGTVTNGPKGLTLTAGPEARNDAHHLVLWTKKSFKGDLKIEFDYTRLDHATQFVNILYIQATGSGVGRFVSDIEAWRDLRRVPAMRTYFDHMHTYHLSFATFPDAENSRSYIRGRRYLPHQAGLNGTELEPDCFPVGLFATGVPHQITVIKKDRDLFIRVANSEQTHYCHLINAGLPIITEGRIGLRHMFTRSARYANFRVSVP
jgi:hypothetical protein